MSGIISLYDEGFRQFGPLPADGAGRTGVQIAEVAGKCADYETIGHWVRRRGRKKGSRLPPSLEIVDVLDAGSDTGGTRLDFLDDYHRSEFANVGGRQLTTSTETLLSLMAEAKEPPRWRGMYRMHQAIHLAGPSRLRPLLRDHVLPCFFNLYPDGQIAVVRCNPIHDRAAALMRLLYAMAQTPLEEFANAEFNGVRTMQEWHQQSLVRLSQVLLNIFLYLFYPFVGGYSGALFGLDILFLFEPAEQYAPGLYPRNWLAVAGRAGGFGNERTNFYKAIQEFQGEDWQHAAHQRFRHDSGYSVLERLAFLRWYVDRVNHLLYELTDVANFTVGNSAEGLIDPVSAFEHYLTIDRLSRLTLQAMSLEETGAAKLRIFEIADQYDSLSHLFGNHTDATGFFKQLFDTQIGPALLRDRLRQLPAPFGAELSALTEQLYRRIEDTVIRSVWLKSKLTPQGVLVRSKNLAQEEVLARPTFVAELMRSYRNAHHGYFSRDSKSQNRPSRYLFLTDGNLPAEMTALPALWWLAYLADPSLVGWKHLPVGAFA